MGGFTKERTQVSEQWDLTRSPVEATAQGSGLLLAVHCLSQAMRAVMEGTMDSVMESVGSFPLGISAFIQVWI